MYGESVFIDDNSGYADTKLFQVLLRDIDIDSKRNHRA